MTINAIPNYEAKSSYSFNVVASDGTLSSTKAVTVSVTDVAPTISSGAAGSVTEGAAAGTTVYTAAATDVAGGTVTYSLSGADAASFSINSSHGRGDDQRQPELRSEKFVFSSTWSPATAR